MDGDNVSGIYWGDTREEVYEQCKDIIPVSYTHLDVYKRQVYAGEIYQYMFDEEVVAILQKITTLPQIVWVQ